MSSDYPELKPAFPSWQRRLDPLLCGEDTNALYEALRRRRKLYPKMRTQRERFANLARAFRAPTIAIVLLGVLIGVAGGLLRIQILGPIAMMVIMLGSVATIIKATQRTPRSAMFLFYFKEGPLFSGDDKYLPERELWLAGVKGSEVLEALYLETMVDMRRVFLIVPWIVPLIAGFRVSLAVVQAQPQFDASALLVLVAAALFAWQATRAALAWAGFFTHVMVIGPRLIIWRATSLAKNILMNMPVALRMYGTMALYAVHIGLGLVWIFVFWGDLASWPGTLWAVLGVSLGFFMAKASRPLLQKAYHNRYRQCLVDGDALLELFVRRHVLQDPDAETPVAVAPVKPSA